MTVRYAVLQKILQEEAVPQENSFLFRLQRAALMALREQGRLSMTEYLSAEERLIQQYRQRDTAIPETE